MRCTVCKEEHRVISDGEDVPRYVRAACKCERRERCAAKTGCIDDVIAAILEPNGITVDIFVCKGHLPRSFDADDFKVKEQVVEEQFLLGDHPASDVVCADCKYTHEDSARILVYRAYKNGVHLGKMVQTSLCPKCRSIHLIA